MKHPEEGQLVIVKCPEFTDQGYVFATYQDGKFTYGSFFTVPFELVEDWISADIVEDIFQNKEVEQ